MWPYKSCNSCDFKDTQKGTPAANRKSNKTARTQITTCWIDKYGELEQPAAHAFPSLRRLGGHGMHRLSCLARRSSLATRAVIRDFKDRCLRKSYEQAARLIPGQGDNPPC